MDIHCCDFLSRAKPFKVGFFTRKGGFRLPEIVLKTDDGCYLEEKKMCGTFFLLGSKSDY